MTIKEPVQRGGAGGVNRFTSGTTAGPACAPSLVSRLAWAVSWPPGPKATHKRAVAVAEYLDGHAGAVVADEWRDGGKVWLSVAVHPAMTQAEATRLAKGCPGYMVGSIAVER
jgi:hypothetical protein